MERCSFEPKKGKDSKPGKGNRERLKAGMLETIVGICHNCVCVLIPGDKEQTAYEMQSFAVSEV